MTLHSRRVRSFLDGDGRLEVTLETVDLPPPDDGQIVVQIEASPVNPSDLSMMLGPADLASHEGRGESRAELAFRIAPDKLEQARPRIGSEVLPGNEAAGTVVQAGAEARDLIGRRVALTGGGLYADRRVIAAAEAVVLPDEVTSAEGAALFINPLTALGFVETARAAGHRALVQTAAASNLGQMLVKLCVEEGLPLVNVVRSPEQVELLRRLGARHVLSSGDPAFGDQLRAALGETGATAVFDAVGGGRLGSDILAAIEAVAVAAMRSFNRYGSDVSKHLYVYSHLDPAPTVLERQRFGGDWDASGWLLPVFLRKNGPDVRSRLIGRAVKGVRTTFASGYGRTIGLRDLLDPEVLQACLRRATGGKFMVDPRLN